jgi:hypothetical protein
VSRENGGESVSRDLSSVAVLRDEKEEDDEDEVAWWACNGLGCW